jgi:hypothetical protein
MNELKLIIKPDEEEEDSAEIYVNGTIGGQPYQFLLDTGAARSEIRFDAYTSRFEVIGQHSSAGVFAKSTNALIRVPAIELGPISRQNFTLVCLPENASHLRNLVGMDLLQDFCCHFLFDESRVLVVPGAEADEGYTFHKLLVDSKFHPYLEVEFGRAQAKAVWDTGASLTIVDLNFIKQQPALFEELGQSTGTDGTGAEQQTSLFLMSPILIGNKEFPAVKVAGVDLSGVNSNIEVPMDLILGYNLLAKAHWLFDFPGRRWAISKLLV